MARCASCRAVVTDEAAFCPRCGASMTGDPAPRPEAHPVATGGPSPYAPTQPVPYASAPTDGSATGALICSILSFVVCPVVLAVVGLVLASSAKKKIRASGGAIGGEGQANAATVISIINIALFVLAFVGIIAVAILGSSSSSKFSVVGSDVGGFIRPLLW